MFALVKILPKQDGLVETLLRQIVIRIFETEINFNKYNWISRCLNEEEKQLPARLQKPSKCRLYATEPILPGVVEFLFDLLDSNGVRVTIYYNLRI